MAQNHIKKILSLTLIDASDFSYPVSAGGTQ